MKWCRSGAALAVALVVAFPAVVGAQATLPAPSYDSTLYAYVYGEGLVSTSLSSFGDSYANAATAGFRIAW